MRKKRYISKKGKKNVVDLHEINELVEMGLNAQEISNELGISKSYIVSLMKDIYKDY